MTPDRLLLLERFAVRLATEGVLRGLIGPREVPRLWERHLLNSAVLAGEMPPKANVADLGSGAGLPGVVLAIARPDLRVTLVEPLLRRTTFLAETIEELGLTGIDVVRGRADSLHGSRSFDVVTSRAVAPLDRLLAWSMPLVAPQGRMIAMKGDSAAAEVESADPVLHSLGCGVPEVRVIGEDVPGATTTVVVVAWADPAAIGWPLAVSTAPRKSQHRRHRSRRRTS